MATATAAELSAQIEQVKAQVQAEKLKQAQSQLAREKIRTGKLEKVADQVLNLDVKRAETNLAIKEQDLAGDALALAAAKDKVSYTKAKHHLQQQQYRIELMTIQHSLAGAEESLRQLKSVAATLNHKIAAAPRLSFASVDQPTDKE